MNRVEQGSLASMPPEPCVLPKRKRRRGRRRPALPRVCAFSARVYVVIDPTKVHLFRYFLEAYDNLGLMTVVDRWRAALMVRYSPHQEEEVLEWLEGMKAVVPFEGPFHLAI